MSFAILKNKNFCTALAVVFVTLTLAGCTQSSKSEFQQSRAEDSAAATSIAVEARSETKSAPVDILWVIDNSDSMATSQNKLKNGLESFANNYLTKSGTDIRLAVITTDTFIANTDWQKYRDAAIKDGKSPTQIRKGFVAKEGASGAFDWDENYAKLSSSALMSSKNSNLLSNFKSRVVVGTKGCYEEHGFDSVDQFINDNENGNSPNKLFRKGSQRVIIFISDEDDQSMGPNVGPEPRKLLYSGSYYTGINPKKADAILPAQFTINCPGDANERGKPITINTAMTLCMRPGTAESVASFKGRLDTFFRTLDGNPNGNPNYLVTAIVGKDPAAVTELRQKTQEMNSETHLTVITNEIGTRYLELVNQAGNGSFAMDIAANKYNTILDKIGLEIVNHSTVTQTVAKMTYKLDRAPDLHERVIVTVQSASGKTYVLAANQFHVAANQFTITDDSLKTVLQPGDRIRVQYQPSTQLPASN